MKNKRMFILSLAFLFSLAAYAQQKKTVTRSECTRLCTQDLPEKLIAASEDIKIIRAALAKETQADVIQTLKKQELEEIQKIRERASLMCEQICLSNPE